jgi:hypothetical protein
MDGHLIFNSKLNFTVMKKFVLIDIYLSVKHLIEEKIAPFCRELMLILFPPKQKIAPDPVEIKKFKFLSKEDEISLDMLMPEKSMR